MLPVGIQIDEIIEEINRGSAQREGNECQNRPDEKWQPVGVSCQQRHEYQDVL